MQQLLATAASARLERLDLGFCGRGLTDASARALAASPGVAPGGLPALASLELGGAYNLTDAALGELLEKATALKRLALPQASKLDGSLIARLPALLPGLQELDIAGGLRLVSVCTRRGGRRARLNG